MNRLTEVFDKMDFVRDRFSDIEFILFGNTNVNFWEETYNTVWKRNSYEIYREILPLFCSLLANLTDEELDEYINSFSSSVIN